MQIRQQILNGFDQGTIQTRAAYLTLEHEWMHLETLAYMLAQEQRLSFERSTAPPRDHVTHVQKNGAVSSDGSSEDEASQHAQHANGHGMSHANGHVNGKGHASSQSNGNDGPNDSSNDGRNGSGASTNGLASRSNGNGISSDHSSVTNGNGHMRRHQDHVTALVSTPTCRIPAGIVTLGTDTDPTKNFVWDNEGPPQSPQHVDSFQMGVHPVTNAQFYTFAVECSGYLEEQYWTAVDLACLKKRKQRCPATWTLQVITCHSLSSALTIIST